MNDGIRPAVAGLLDDVVAVRREVHRHAELSTEEWHTQGIILNWLKALGLEDVRPVADTGATGLIRGARPGSNVLWRADIDALPLVEETGLAFASDRKAMHACGHDGHVAIALGIASVLQAGARAMSGSVRFAFQPAEEHVGGARRMIDEGIMDEPRIDRVFGLHIWAPNKTGEVGVRPGSIFAAATHFRIIIRGRGGHAAAPHETIDPIVVSAHVIVALQTVVSRSTSPEQPVVLTVGRIAGGVRGNIIPDQVMMSGTIRTFDDDTLADVLARAESIIRGVTEAWDAEYQFDTSTLPAVVNDSACARLVAECAGGLVGDEHVIEERTMGGDDMAYFLERAPGAYFFLGGSKPGATVWPHHHAKFDFDEACLPLGIELGARIIERATESALE